MVPHVLNFPIGCAERFFSMPLSATLTELAVQRERNASFE
jgi:hypothetical protein